MRGGVARSSMPPAPGGQGAAHAAWHSQACGARALCAAIPTTSADAEPPKPLSDET